MPIRRSSRALLRELVSAWGVSAAPAAAQPTALLMVQQLDEFHSGSPLMGLGREFDFVAGEIDYAIGNGRDIRQVQLDEFARIEAIAAIPAGTIYEFFVKARVVCWALLGDFDSADQSTADKRMAISIVRDLIRLCEPRLERPGAVKRLLKDIETNAGSS